MQRDLIEKDGMDEAALEALVERTSHGDKRAWQALWLALAPIVEGVARRWRVTGRLSRCPDSVGDVVVHVMGELREDGFRRLAELGERLARRDGSFRGWLRTVARNAAVSYVRGHAEYLGPVEGEASRWATHVPLPEDLEAPVASADRRVEAREILAISREVLDPAQRAALDLWIQGADAAAIARTLSLAGDAGAAASLVRSALMRLRRRFEARAMQDGSIRSTRCE